MVRLIKSRRLAIATLFILVISLLAALGKHPSHDAADLHVVHSETQQVQARVDRAETRHLEYSLENSTTEPRADDFMLMMQGMAGIGPEDSKWVASKLFQGFVPAPMPCCGPPGSKVFEEEHDCCRNQRKSIELSSKGVSFAAKARLRFEEQFSPMLGTADRLARGSLHSSQVRDARPAFLKTSTLSTADSGEQAKFEGLRVAVHVRSDQQNELPEIVADRTYDVSAISIPIIYNRFGSNFKREVSENSAGPGRSIGARDENGTIFVLEKDMARVRAGANYFNAGHDSIYYGVGRDGQLFLKDPRTGLYLKQDNKFTFSPEERVPVLTVEPLVIRANCGDTIVIDFTNRLKAENGGDAPVANLMIEGATYDTGAKTHVGQNFVSPLNNEADEQPQIRYVINVGDDPATEGTYYFHSKPIDPQDIAGSLKKVRTQTSHGLFGALIIEPKGSEFYDSYSFKIEEGTKDGKGNYKVDCNSYVPIDSGWAAIVYNKFSKTSFREHVIFFHDDLGNGLMSDSETAEPRALSYRYAGFNEIFGKRSGGGQPFAINDRSMAYSAYTYGDSSTPHPRFYVGDPMRYRIVHGGAGDEFHVFHHHAHRWRFQPKVRETGTANESANLTEPSKRGRPEDATQPDLTIPISARLDSQTLGPGETFDVFMEGGAGGVQRTVGDALLHCHIIEHVTQGMWTYTRVYNTLQEPGRNYYPPLAPLPDRLSEELLPPIAVDSLTLQEMVKNGEGPEPISGPLAGERIQSVEGELFPYIENQLPPRGLPNLDKKADDQDGQDGKNAEINRADQWDWETLNVPDKGRLYFGERYDLGDFEGGTERSQSYVKFGVGYPTAGEGIGAYRNEPHPLDENLPPIDRPRLLFNPRDGRLAYPHLLPHAGRRPPFAPRTRLEKNEGGSLVLVKDDWRQGTAYLDKTLEKTNKHHPSGSPNGSGLAPEGVPVRRYDLVALPLSIDYASQTGKPLARSVQFKREHKGDVVSGQTHRIKTTASPNTWSPNVRTIQPGDVVEWWNTKNQGHQLKFEKWNDIRNLFDEIESDAGFNRMTGQMDNAVDSNKSTDTLMLRATIGELGSIEPLPTITFHCLVHPVMTGKLADVPSNVDEQGQIFVLADDAPDIIAGRKPAEPLVLRANVGDVVEIRLRSALLDDRFGNRDYSKVGIHTHLVQYDAQSSDGAVGGLNYETSIRPSLEWDHDTGAFKLRDEDVRHEEAVHYRWWCDTELGTVYFHDHSLLKDSLPHGLFGATIVEPKDSSYHDPVSGKRLYVEQADSTNSQLIRISRTNGTIQEQDDKAWSRGIAVASIHTRNEARPSFREFVPLFQDTNKPNGITASVNLRSAQLRRADSDGDGELDPGIERPFSNLFINYAGAGRKPQFFGGKATLFSSKLNGDPVTPIWRAYPGDLARIRVEGGATNFIHSLTVHGHRWRNEQDNPTSTLRDFGLAGVSEAFTFATRAAGKPGDYLYGSTGSRDVLDRGKWGIWRIQSPGTSSMPAYAQGKARVFFADQREGNEPFPPFKIKQGTRFYSRKGIEYQTVSDTTVEMSPQRLDESGREYLDIEVRAVLPGDSGNLPFLKRLGFEEDSIIPQGVPLKVDRVVVFKPIRGGFSPLQPLPAARENPQPANLNSDAGTDQTSELLLPAPQPDAEHNLYVAALQVPLSVGYGGQRAAASVPILAYVPIADNDQETLAEKIVKLARTGAQGDNNSEQESQEQLLSAKHRLRRALTTQFLRGQRPFVYRIAAPGQGEDPVRLAIRLINLLPTRAEMAARFPFPLSERPFGEPYSPLTSLHLSLGQHDAASDGTAVGKNEHSLVAPGDARTYVWTIDKELGICYLRDTADPEHQTSGLFGAVVVEPHGTRFLSGTDGTETLGSFDTHAIVVNRQQQTSFREYVLLLQDGFDAQPEGFAINYRTAADDDHLRPPHLRVHEGDRVRVRQIHAAGTGDQSGNHSFYIGGRRWRIDNQDPNSNRIAAIAEAPAVAINASFTIDDRFEVSDSSNVRTYLYGSHVGKQSVAGEWGLFTVLKRTDKNKDVLHPLPDWTIGEETRTGADR